MTARPDPTEGQRATGVAIRQSWYRAGGADGIRSLLDPDAVLVIDSGGHGTAPTSPVRGADAATRELLRLMRPEISVTMASINSVPGFVLVRDGRVVCAVTADMRAGAFSDVWVVCNPDKLRHWNRGEAWG